MILPEYLEMWYMGSEFDREAAFIAGGVRGSMPWEDFAKLKLPVLDIAEQEEIVSSYRAVTDRIALNMESVGIFESEYLEILFNPVKKLVGLRESEEGMPGAVRWKRKNNGKYETVSIGRSSFSFIIYDL